MKKKSKNTAQKNEAGVRKSLENEKIPNLITQHMVDRANDDGWEVALKNSFHFND